MSDVQKYTGNNHLRCPGFHMSVGNPSVLLRDGNRKWLMEWHYYFGPSVVTKAGAEAKKQPGEQSRFWLVATWWKDQGAKVVDGVGIWEEPPIETTKYRKVRGKGLVQDDQGEVAISHFKGYPQFGAISQR